MFDIGIGFSEIMLIAVILIIVVGPEELPSLLRTIGRYVGQVKRVADDFRAQVDEAIKDTEIDKIKDEIDDMTGSMEGVVEDLNDPFGEADLIDFEEHNRKVLADEEVGKMAKAGEGAADQAGETATQKALRESGVAELKPKKVKKSKSGKKSKAKSTQKAEKKAAKKLKADNDVLLAKKSGA